MMRSCLRHLCPAQLLDGRCGSGAAILTFPAGRLAIAAAAFFFVFLNPLSRLSTWWAVIAIIHLALQCYCISDDARRM